MIKASSFLLHHPVSVQPGDVFFILFFFPGRLLSKNAEKHWIAAKLNALQAGKRQKFANILTMSVHFTAKCADIRK
jgi:hypothetical protein